MNKYVRNESIYIGRKKRNQIFKGREERILFRDFFSDSRMGFGYLVYFGDRKKKMTDESKVQSIVIYGGFEGCFH